MQDLIIISCVVTFMLYNLHNFNIAILRQAASYCDHFNKISRYLFKSVIMRIQDSEV